MSHIRRIDLQPNPLIPGKPVTVTLEVDDPAAITSAKVYDPRGEELRFTPCEKDGKTVFSLTEQVPYDAGAGTYYATLVLQDTSGSVERKTFDITIA